MILKSLLLAMALLLPLKGIAAGGATGAPERNGYEMTREGAWCWFADPRAFHHESRDGRINKSYVGYIDRHGNIKAMQYDFLNHRQQEVLIRSWFQPDDHDNPTFLILPDDRVMIFYSRHTDEPCFYYRISRKPGDITTLGEEKRINVKNNTTYPSPFILSDDPTHIYLCWRGIKWHPTIARLTMPDSRDSVTIDWGPLQMVQSTAARPYCKYQSNGKDRIYLAYTTGHPDPEYPNHLYFNFVDIATRQLKDINGRVLSNIADGPFQVNKSEDFIKTFPATIIDAPANKRDWVWQIAHMKDGAPVVAMVRISEDKTSHDFYYARWNGQEWQKTFLGNAGGHFHQTPKLEMCYSSGMAIDPAHPEVIYASLPTEGRHGRKYELYRFTIADDGTIARRDTITRNSEENNVRPYVLPGSENSPLRLAWMYGRYYDWIVSRQRPLGYDTSIRSDFGGFPTELNTETPEVKTAFTTVKGMTRATFGARADFTLVAEIDSLPADLNGPLLTVGAISYNVRNGRPEIAVGGKTFRSTNLLATADSWQQEPRGTNGRWYAPQPLKHFTLVLTYHNGVLKSYVNGLLDQHIDMAGIRVANAFLLNPGGRNRLTVRQYSGAKTYYVSSLNGNDKDDGLSAARAWKTLKHVSGRKLSAGDRILLERGSAFYGCLDISGEGTEEAPVEIGAYGNRKALPQIIATDGAQYAVRISNSTFLTIRDMEIVNHGSQRQAGRTGLKIESRDYGVSKNIVVDGVTVRDVNGSLVKEEGGGSGILIVNGGRKVVSTFEDMRIENCIIRNCARNAMIWSGYASRKNWHPSRRTIVRGNLIEGVPGDGIVPIGCDCTLIAFNIMRNCPDILPAKTEAAAGFWPWSCDNTTIEYNEVSGHKAPWDGQAYDSDYNCNNTTIRYNYSHDNYGGLVLVCNNGDSPEYRLNRGTVVRGNISIGDGMRPTPARGSMFSPLIHISGPVSNTLFEHNILYMTAKPAAGIDRTMISSGNWGGYADSTTFRRNVFYAAEKSRFDLQQSTRNTFDGNSYEGTFDNLPDDRNAMKKDITVRSIKALLDTRRVCGTTLHYVNKERLEKWFEDNKR